MYKNNGLEYESEYEFQLMMDKIREARKEEIADKEYFESLSQEYTEEFYDD